MNVSAVNLYGSTPQIGASRYAGTAKYVPSDKERQEKLSKIDEKANGGTSKDGDTVTVSAEGSRLQKMYEGKSPAKNTFLKEDEGEGNSVAETISKGSEKLGITPEANEKKVNTAGLEMIKAGLDDAGDAKSEKKVDTDNLSSYSNNELKQLYEDGNITSASYKSEMESRATNGVKKAEDRESALQDVKKEEPKEDISTAGKKAEADEERLSSIREKNRAEEKRQNDKLRDEALTEKAQERRAENTDKRLDNERENAEAKRQADKELYNVAFSFQDSPYDVTSSIKEMEEDESEIGVNRIEAPGTPEREPAREAAPALRNEGNRIENTPLEDVSSTVNSENVAQTDNSQNIQAAEVSEAQNTIDENAVNNRVTVQEVA